ncbi:hypothetical protein A2U01_0105794, partial [Trifolium medium]|nr:hypothetical protein [Trifolium medium]
SLRCYTAAVTPKSPSLNPVVSPPFPSPDELLKSSVFSSVKK